MEDRIRLLYAEDDPSDGDLTRTYFEAHAPEFDLEIVETGGECLGRLRESKYDLLLLDYRLPDYDGSDVLRELSLAGISLPVVVVTGVGDDKFVLQSLNLGASDYVAKTSGYLARLPAVLRSIAAEYGKQRAGTIEVRRILYVEHDQMDVDLTLDHLGKTAPHLKVEAVKSGREALEILSRDRGFDLVLADLRMPDIGALELLKEMRQRGTLLPFIIVTGQGDEEAAVAALRMGADDYIIKRDSYLTQLPHAIGHAVDRARLDQTNKRLQVELAEMLRQSEEGRERLAGDVRLLLESTSEGICGLDLEGRITLINRAGARMLGFEGRELLGRDMHSHSHHSRSDGSPYPAKECPIHQTLQSGLECRVDSEMFWRRDLTGFAVEYSASPIKERGVIKGTVVTFSDITERKRLKEQLLQSQKMEAIGRLAGGVAHDFNNLLTAILGYSELVLANLKLNRPVREEIEEITKAAERASSLTSQLLAFSRKQVLQPQVLDLNAVIARTEKMLQRLIGEDLELITVLHPELGRVKADPGHMEQIIMNLAVNARDAMPGGGKLTIETANVVLDDEYARRHIEVAPGAYVMLAMSDTGQGMDDETRSHIFEPFFSTKEQGKGTGLGLSTVYGIVKQSGGYIWVYSEPGTGSSFKIYLPRIEESPNEIRPRDTLGPVPRGTETVLLVEDEPTVLKLASSLLRKLGYKVLEASNGQEALALVKEECAGREIDLVMTDVVMPEMGGMALTNRLRVLRPEIKVLFTSGYTDEAVLIHKFISGDVPFLQKPFTAESLARKVREVLDR